MTAGTAGFDTAAHCAAMRAAYQRQADARREDYLWCREQRDTIRQAAARVGISYRTAMRYEESRRPKRTKAGPWTPEETALALRTDLAAREVAVMTGRSEWAVRRRRHYVRKAGLRSPTGRGGLPKRAARVGSTPTGGTP